MQVKMKPSLRNKSLLPSETAEEFTTAAVLAFSLQHGLTMVLTESSYLCVLFPLLSLLTVFLKLCGPLRRVLLCAFQQSEIFAERFTGYIVELLVFIYVLFNISLTQRK